MTVQAERTTFTVLSDEHDLIPITDRPTVYVEGIDPALAARFGRVVGGPAQAQVALVRLKCGDGVCDGSAVDDLDHLIDVVETTTTLVDVCPALPAVLSPLIGQVKATLMSSGVGDEEFLQRVFGRAPELHR